MYAIGEAGQLRVSSQIDSFERTSRSKIDKCRSTCSSCIWIQISVFAINMMGKKVDKPALISFVIIKLSLTCFRLIRHRRLIQFMCGCVGILKHIKFHWKRENVNAKRVLIANLMPFSPKSDDFWQNETDYLYLFLLNRMTS